MRRFSVSSIVVPSALAFASLAGCASDVVAPDATPPLVPILDDGKADVGSRVSRLGALPFAPGEITGAFAEDLEFHGYSLDVRAGARVSLEVTQRGSSRGLDTSMFVYGPAAADGTFGSTARDFDDDAGWGKLSRLRGLELDDAGTYLVVVGTKDGRGRGRYRLEAKCDSGECAPLPPPPPPPPPSGACPAPIRTALDRCVADWMENEPEWFYTMSRRDLVEGCGDAEPMAPARDAMCAAPGAPAELCALSYEDFTYQVLPVCRREAMHGMLDALCVFGDRYRDAFTSGALVVTSSRVLTADSELSPIETNQLLRAVTASTYEATTTAQVFEQVDGGEVNQTEFWDASARRAFTAYEFGAGDNSFGMFFWYGTTRTAARINDGDLYECEPKWGEERRECTSEDDCRAGTRCIGSSEASALARCVNTRGYDHPASDRECSAEAPCPNGSGLVCAGGYCRDAWMRGHFESNPALAIPDNSPAGAEASLLVYGLATVETEVLLDLSISHPRIKDLRVTLVHASGTEAPVFSGEYDGPQLYLRNHPVMGFSGDEYVNGVWKLKVVDTRSGRTGSIGEFGLTITSRWD